MKRLLVVLITIAVLAGCSSTDPEKFHPGDIIFQQTTSSQAKAIMLATGSKWTHCGMLYKRNDGWVVFEAVEPVKVTPFKEWIKRGVGKGYAVKRLNRELNKIEITRLRLAFEKYKGRHYDLLFKWSDEKIYCSELIWKMFNDALGIRLCVPRQWNSYALSSKEVQTLIKKRYGKGLNLNEPVVSPEDLYKSPQLISVN